MPQEKDLILIFSLNICKFAIEVKHLVEVAKDLKMSARGRVNGCLGGAEFHGKTIPLLDFSGRLGFTGESREHGAAIVVNFEGNAAAVSVDAVEGVFEAGGRKLQFPDIMMSEKGIYPFIYESEGSFVLGVDMARLFSKDLVARLTAVVEGKV